MATKKKQEEINDIHFVEALEERYLAYALSTIMSRSLPDVRDGMKPVHRRLLYAMLQLKLDPASGFKKCARVVGDVIGKYHPHGDTAVYDAMVRLAQGFSVRYPLVDGQGNFGSVDGDNAAAMRYTEARLTEVSLALLKDIDQNTVDFRPTYDGEDSEPVVLPAAFPNLLANGAEGIAVGMATSIPPHNVGEICDALSYLIENEYLAAKKDQKEVEVKELLRFVKGPDFPTGGIIAETKQNIRNAYSTGKGAFRMRARWEKEELSRGLYQIVITEIPYQVQKSKLIEKIAELYKAKKLALLGNIRDESAEEIRIVLEPKNRTVDPEVLMESLFRLTDLESRFNMNLNVLTSSGVPKVLNLKEVLAEFLLHRQEVLVRRSEYRLEKIAHRLEVLDGFLIVYLNIDEVIHIIRHEDNPKAVMMKKWDLSEVQVEAILNMRLRSLRKLEEIEIQKEHKKLSAEKKALEGLLKSEKKQWQAIDGEIGEIKEKFGKQTKLGKRRTRIADAPDAKVISVEAFVEKEPITIIYSKMGWIRALKGHFEELPEIKYKEGDDGRYIIDAQTTDKLIVFGTNGRFYTINCTQIPTGRGYGEPIRLMIDLPNNEEVVDMHVYKPEQKLLLASKAGRGFIVAADDVMAQTKNGKQVLSIKAGDQALKCEEIEEEHDHVAVVGDNRKLLVFPLDQIPEMKKGAGVKLQRYKDGGLSDLKCITLSEGLEWQTKTLTRHEPDLREWLGDRAQAGRLPPRGFPRNNKFE